MRPAVDGEFVPAPGQLTGLRRMPYDVLAQDEEGRPHAEPVEHVQEERRGHGVGPVVEGEGHVIGAALSGQRGQQ